MRIAQLASRAGNGAARHSELLCAALTARGHDVTLFHRDPVETTNDLKGVRLVQTTMARRPAELRRVNAIMTDLGIDVMHSHMSRAHAFAALLRLMWRRPVVATAHARHIQMHWCVNDRVIAPAQSTADYAHRINWVSHRRLSVIPNFVDPHQFSPATPARRAAMRRLLGVPDDAFVVGCVGPVSLAKNQSDLVAAIGALARGGIAAWLVLVGPRSDSAEDGRIDDRIAEFGLKGRILRLGRRTDVADLLCGFDVYAQTSRREEMPLSILEAMATGLPVVGTGIGGIPEMVPQEDRRWLTRPGHIAGLVDALRALATSPDLRAAIGQRARQRAAEDMSEAVIVPRIERVLAAAVAERRRAVGPTALPKVPVRSGN